MARSSTSSSGEADERPRGQVVLTPHQELQLLDAWKRGDEAALAELLMSYQRRIYGVCYRMLGNPTDAADLAQECLVKMIEGLPSYDGRAKLSTWVIRVSMNCCLSHLRREKLRRHGSLDSVDGESGLIPEAREPSAIESVQWAERREIAAIALRCLDPMARAILVLRDLQGLEYQLISDVLDIPVGTVKSRIFRARVALREAIEARGGNEEGQATPSDGVVQRHVDRPA